MEEGAYVFAKPKREFNNSVAAKLADAVQAPLSDVLADLQSKPRRNLRLVKLECGGVDARAYLDDNKVLLVLLAAAELEEVRLLVDVVDVDKTLADKLLTQFRHCRTQVHCGHSCLTHCDVFTSSCISILSEGQML